MSHENGMPLRSFQIRLEIPDVKPVPTSLALQFAQCMAEAQMLEHALKTTISKDIRIFANPAEEVPFLEILEKLTLGQTEQIAAGISKSHPQIAACIGFFDFVKMQWHLESKKEEDLRPFFKQAVRDRNRVAHQLIADYCCNSISESDATQFLKDSTARFAQVRHLVLFADALSEKFGSVAEDGRSLPRFKTTQ